MLVVLIVLSVGLLGTIIYFAFSKKSSRLLRISSLAALGLIGLSLGICAIFLVIGPGEEEGSIALPFITDTPEPKGAQRNTFEIVLFIAVFLGIMGLILGLYFRDYRKKSKQSKPAVKKAAFKNDGELYNLGLDSEKTEEKKDEIDDLDFDIGLDLDDNR